MLAPPTEEIAKDELVDAMWRPVKTELGADVVELVLYCRSHVAFGPAGPGSVGNRSRRLWGNCSKL